jgi:tRNA (guanine37-N1)-methyltransferase
MRIDILTLFPEMFPAYLDQSILKRAQEAGLLEVRLHNIRDWAAGKHRVTDEPPYGGGGGMVLKPEPIFLAVEEVLGVERGAWSVEREERSREEGNLPSQGRGQELRGTQGNSRGGGRVVLLTPQGRVFDQKVAWELAGEERLVLVCGRYEGVDERVREYLVTDEISIGDYVLTGGELAAMVVVDAVARLLPGALGAEGAAETDSHATGLLEGPHYTRPEKFRGWSVPAVLRSGHAAKIERWRREQSLRRTWQRRPELLLTAELSEADKGFLAILAGESVESKAY